MIKTQKTAVILFNMGGPEKQQDIAPFLYNFFSDRAIFDLPTWIRLPLARFLSLRRAYGAAGKAYGLMGGGSPILTNTKAQAQALEIQLNTSFDPSLGKDNTSYSQTHVFSDKARGATCTVGYTSDEATLSEDTWERVYKVFTCMRYWHPMPAEIAREVETYDPDEIILLPLYPQYSTTTTASFFKAWAKEESKAVFPPITRSVCCYPTHQGFIAASAARIQDALAQAAQDGHFAPRVLLSAHGLPERIIAKGDPYQKQCEATATAIATYLGLCDWQICYQSRVGPLKWTEPSIEEALQRAAHDKKAVVVYPHAFTQEHEETLVELDREYHEKAQTLGVPYYRAKTVGTHPAFIAGLAALVYAAQSNVYETCQQKGYGDDKTAQNWTYRCGTNWRDAGSSHSSQRSG